jgi:hypothetical protein
MSRPWIYTRSKKLSKSRSRCLMEPTSRWLLLDTGTASNTLSMSSPSYTSSSKMGYLDEKDEVMLRFIDSTKSKTELKPAKRPARKLSQQTVVGTADGQTNGQQCLGTPCPLSHPKILDDIIASPCAGWTNEGSHQVGLQNPKCRCGPVKRTSLIAYLEKESHHTPRGQK